MPRAKRRRCSGATVFATWCSGTPDEDTALSACTQVEVIYAIRHHCPMDEPLDIFGQHTAHNSCCVYSSHPRHPQVQNLARGGVLLQFADPREVDTRRDLEVCN